MAEVVDARAVMRRVRLESEPPDESVKGPVHAVVIEAGAETGHEERSGPEPAAIRRRCSQQARSAAIVEGWSGISRDFPNLLECTVSSPFGPVGIGDIQPDDLANAHARNCKKTDKRLHRLRPDRWPPSE